MLRKTPGRRGVVPADPEPVAVGRLGPQLGVQALVNQRMDRGVEHLVSKTGEPVYASQRHISPSLRSRAGAPGSRLPDALCRSAYQIPPRTGVKAQSTTSHRTRTFGRQPPGGRRSVPRPGHRGGPRHRSGLSSQTDSGFRGSAESRRDQDHPVRSNAEAQSLQGRLSRHIAARLGMPGSIRRGNAAFESPTGADAPEQPVLDVATSRIVIARGIPNGSARVIRGLIDHSAHLSDKGQEDRPPENGGRLAFAERRRPSSIQPGMAPASAPAIRHSRAADRASGSSGSPSLVPSKMPAAWASRSARPGPARAVRPARPLPPRR